MTQRTLAEIRHDLRACYENAGLGQKMRDREVVEHFLREARACEREMEIRKTGHVLTLAH